MSDTKKNVTTNNEEAKEARTPYDIGLEEPIPFDQDFSGKYISSVALCRLVNQLYRAGFEDYIGCTFDVVSGQPMISMYFSHARTTEDGTYACERGDGKVTNSSLLDRTRTRDRQMREGDRYRLTEDGKDVFSKLLLPRFYNNGKPQWNNVVSEILDNSAATMYNNKATQLTKITGIDPKKICAKLWGNENHAEYGVQVTQNLNFNNPALAGGTQAPNYVLSITKAFADNLGKTCESFGFGGFGSPIVR